MDSSGWIVHGYTNATATGAGNHGFTCGNAASMHLSMDDDDQSAVYGAATMDDLLMPSPLTHHAAAAAGSFPSSSSSSASFRSASVSYSPDTSAAAAAAPFLAAPAAAATGFQYPEVSSQATLPPPLVPYEPQHGHYTAGLLSAAELPATGGAFRRYSRHLGPRRAPKPGSCGQRMFKTAMSVLAKMHRHRQYYYQQAAAASASGVEAPPPSGNNQLQHTISERKRREKLNGSFVALKAVLPPGSKKDKTSILIRAREYVKSLESKLSELEEKNRKLEARLASRPAVVAAKNDKGETAAEAGGETKREDIVEIEVTTSGTGAADAAAATGGEETCTLNVDLRGGGGGRGMSATDVVLRTLQCLREQIGDGASLVAMSTSAGSGGRPPRANLTLQLKDHDVKMSYWYEGILHYCTNPPATYGRTLKPCVTAGMFSRMKIPLDFIRNFFPSHANLLIGDDVEQESLVGNEGGGTEWRHRAAAPPLYDAHLPPRSRQAPKEAERGVIGRRKEDTMVDWPVLVAMVQPLASSLWDDSSRTATVSSCPARGVASSTSSAATTSLSLNATVEVGSGEGKEGCVESPNGD
uniref:BHLH domain-containing protein n=1 Tax=Oryza punctata TaxID=4537 RepID=A0A0E0JF67_ORYPU